MTAIQAYDVSGVQTASSPMSPVAAYQTAPAPAPTNPGKTPTTKQDSATTGISAVVWIVGIAITMVVIRVLYEHGAELE